MIHTSTARHHELKVSLQSGITYLLWIPFRWFQLNAEHTQYQSRYTSFQRMLLFLLSSALYISYSFAHTRTHTHKSKAKPLTALVGHAFLCTKQALRLPPGARARSSQEYWWYRGGGGLLAPLVDYVLKIVAPFVIKNSDEYDQLVPLAVEAQPVQLPSTRPGRWTTSTEPLDYTRRVHHELTAACHSLPSLTQCRYTSSTPAT